MMEVLKQNSSSISRTIGRDYSFLEKLKLKGTGSSKLIYVEGVLSLNKLANSSQSHSFASFQLYPKGIVIRMSKNGKVEGIVLKKEEIEEIAIVARRIKIKNRSFLRLVKYKVVHDATLSIQLKSGEPILFYCLTAHYRNVLPFFRKDWLKSKLHFSVDPADPVLDTNGLIVDAIMDLAN